jgi:hypothetical protein
MGTKDIKITKKYSFPIYGSCFKCGKSNTIYILVI